MISSTEVFCNVLLYFSYQRHFQASIEQQSWPYSFPLSNDYPHANQRGTVRGRLQVSDRYRHRYNMLSSTLYKSTYNFNFLSSFRYMNQGLINAGSAYVGLAPKGDEVSWQKENKVTHHTHTHISLLQ